MKNENYTLHFMFSYKYSTYQIFMDTCNENIKITYQLVRRQVTCYTIIHQEKYI